jgi:hypothetical protein
MSKITVDRALLEQALEALENSSPDQYPEDAGVFYDARDALRAALDQPEQEPVAWVNSADIISSKLTRERGGQGDVHTWSETKSSYHDRPLYTTSREWVSLTQEEPHPDTVRLEYLYSRRGTDSMALVELEMKVLFGEAASLEEARAAIDEAMANPSKEKNCG